MIQNQEKELQQFQDRVKASRRIVFFGGAGVSTESGIPDFRSVDGLYQQKYKYPPETILSHTFFVQKPEEFFEFYWDKMIYPDARPNITHQVLARLEQEGKLSAVITQNIDGLHQQAGSRRVLELHGSVLRNYCQKCARFYSLEELLLQNNNAPEGGDIPRCVCGGIIKPDVVLYEEPLNDRMMGEAIEEIEQADMLIVGGTSLSVYPAAGLIQYFNGGRHDRGSSDSQKSSGGLVLINKSETPYDHRADLVLHMGLGEAFGAL